MPQLPPASLITAPIAVTGFGICSAAGDSAETTWRSAQDGIVPAQFREFCDGRKTLKLPVCPATKAFDSRVRDGRLRRLDRSVQLALDAAHEAWSHAGLDYGFDRPDRSAVIAGTSRGAVAAIAHAAQALGSRRARPTDAPNTAIACLSGALSAELGIHGPAFTVSATCTSSATAIVLGAQQILTGLADIALVGGAESPLNDLVLSQLHNAGVLAHHEDPKLACRPFDRARTGTVLGEGAGFLVLESVASAQRRGARIQALMSGWALGSEGAPRATPDASGGALRRVIEQSLTTAGRSPEEIDYVNFHGTGTVLNDRAEIQALRLAFSDHADRVACSSTKPITGHCMGAASAIEAIISIQTLGRTHWPQTVNCPDPEPDSPLTFFQPKEATAPIKTVMSLSSGFWGTHASLVFTSV